MAFLIRSAFFSYCWWWSVFIVPFPNFLICMWVPFTSFGNLSLNIALPLSLYLFYQDFCYSFSVYVYSSIFLFVHLFLCSFKHLITGILKSLSANSKPGSSVNLFYLLIWGRFPCLFPCIVISNCTLSIVCKQTIDTTDDVFYLRRFNTASTGGENRGTKGC